MFSVKFHVSLGVVGIEGNTAVSERRRLGLADGPAIWFNGSTVINGIPYQEVAGFPEFDKSACPTFCIPGLDLLTADDVEERETGCWSYGQPDHALNLVVKRDLSPSRAVGIIRALKAQKAEAEERRRQQEEEARRKEVVENLRAQVAAKQDEAKQLGDELSEQNALVASLRTDLYSLYNQVSALGTAKAEAEAELASVKASVAAAAEEIDRTRRFFKSRVLAGIRITLERISQ